jgi:hypothetical protein
MRIRRIVLFVLTGLLGLCLLAAAMSALSNIGLPTHAQAADRLSALDKARLAEATHLRRTLGDATWPGWGAAAIPFLVYNEEYAFLVGLPDPVSGWVTVPQGQVRGGQWEVVPGDTFDGEVYYRQSLAGLDTTPQSFVPKVGDHLVATLRTLESQERAFYADVPSQLPAALRPFVPYRLVWFVLMGETDTYIGALEHEAFHANEAQMAPGRVARAENVMLLEKGYPFDDPAQRASSQSELDLLVRAAQAADDDQARSLARQFLAARDARRVGLAPELVDFERQREWLEGLAKYSELAITRRGGSTPGYAALPALAADRQFRGYATRQRFWGEQLAEAGRLYGRNGEVRFYYSGLDMAALLDRLAPGWQTRALNDSAALEDLLREAVR